MDGTVASQQEGAGVGPQERLTGSILFSVCMGCCFLPQSKTMKTG